MDNGEENQLGFRQKAVRMLASAFAVAAKAARPTAGRKLADWLVNDIRRWARGKPREQAAGFTRTTFDQRPPQAKRPEM